MQFSLDEVCILPSSKVTDINSRSEVDPYINGKLPIFVSPMTCIIDENNFDIFKASKAEPIWPRKNKPDYDPFCHTNDWIAVSLKELENCNYNLNGMKILVDTANGHMKKLYDVVRTIKEKNPEVTIMVGNIAHPEIYQECCMAGVDYVRVSCGTGSVCGTSVKTGIHASMQWLLSEISKIKSRLGTSATTKIIADGGLNISRSIKALALGADYVMLGREFAQCKEACGPLREKYPNSVGYPERLYYGMASSRGKKDLGSSQNNIEGTETWLPVNTTLDKFLTEFEEALRSAMSYTGSHNLEEFKHVQTDIQTISEFKAYNK